MCDYSIIKETRVDGYLYMVFYIPSINEYLHIKTRDIRSVAISAAEQGISKRLNYEQ